MFESSKNKNNICRIITVKTTAQLLSRLFVSTDTICVLWNLKHIKDTAMGAIAIKDRCIENDRI
jgi:hypothetical protein